MLNVEVFGPAKTPGAGIVVLVQAIYRTGRLDMNTALNTAAACPLLFAFVYAALFHFVLLGVEKTGACILVLVRASKYRKILESWQLWYLCWCVVGCLALLGMEEEDRRWLAKEIALTFPLFLRDQAAKVCPRSFGHLELVS
jgi:hypothetical protein